MISKNPSSLARHSLTCASSWHLLPWRGKNLFVMSKKMIRDCWKWGENAIMIFHLLLPQIRHKSLDCIANWFPTFSLFRYGLWCIQMTAWKVKKLWNSLVWDIQKLITNKDKHQVIFCSMDLEIAPSIKCWGVRQNGNKKGS